jgi:CheY-like chemotaxis protein
VLQTFCNGMPAIDTAAFRILLAEDNPGDVLLFREALRNGDFRSEIVVAEDGQQAITLVESAANGGPRPHLIVLDVNLPKHNGDEVLRHIRKEPALAGVPVMMLTSSASPADQETADRLGVDLYLQKPSDLEALLGMGKIIGNLLGPTSTAAAM